MINISKTFIFLQVLLTMSRFSLASFISSSSISSPPSLSSSTTAYLNVNRNDIFEKLRKRPPLTIEKPPLNQSIMSSKPLSQMDDNVEPKKSFHRFLQIFSAKLVLEVFGGGGAIWGFAEVLTLRNPETQEFWRFNALVAATIFFVRFLLQCNDYLSEMSGKYSSLYDDKRGIRGLQIFSAKIVLEVFGAAGAIWGFSEVLTLRRLETLEFWRSNALVIGFIFFIRFVSQMVDFTLEMKQRENFLKRNSAQWTRLSQIFSAKLVLEVFGGAGAIWGFSEIITLRNAETIGTWRICALISGTIFLIRWIMQITDYVREIKEENNKSQIFELKDGLAVIKDSSGDVDDNGANQGERSPLVK